MGRKRKQRPAGLFDTTNMRSKKEVEKSLLGELSNDGKDWTDEELDRFFDGYFAGRGIYTLCKELGRSENAVSTICWKVAEGYRGLVYTPGKRLSRKGKAFHPRERNFVRLCLKYGRPISDAAAFLVRPAREVKGLLK